MSERELKEYRDRYVKEEDIKLALSKYVVPKVAVEQFHDNLKLGLYQRIVNDKVCLAVTEVEVMITEWKRNLLATMRELPLNRWLYEYIYRRLDSSSFIAEYREENIKDKFQGLNITEVNKYAKSLSDLVSLMHNLNH